MKKTVVKKIIRVPATDAWDVISHPEGVENYLPAISSSEVVINDGNFTRNIFLMDGSFYEETINSIDQGNKQLHYHINEPSPFPYANLSGSIQVIPVGETSCEVIWSCRYFVNNDLAVQIDELLTLIINLAIKGVQRHCTKALALA